MKRFAPLAGTLAGTAAFACALFAPYVPRMPALGLAVVSFFVTSLGTAYNWPVQRVPVVVPTE